MDLKPGMIVWATVRDPNGYAKDRPLVILALPPDQNQPIICCACTTKDMLPRPATYLLLPWDAQGRNPTGLRQQTFAVANWGVKVFAKDVRRKSGRISDKLLKTLLEMVAKPLRP